MYGIIKTRPNIGRVPAIAARVGSSNSRKDLTSYKK